MEVRNLELFQSVFMAMPCPALLLRAAASDFEVVAVNSAWEAMSGEDALTMPGKKFSGLFKVAATSGQDAAMQRLHSSLFSVAAGGGPQHLKNQNHLLNGLADAEQTRFLDVTIAPLPGNDGRVQFILYSATNVPEGAQASDQSPFSASEQNGLERARDEKLDADQSNALLHAIIDTAQAGIFLFSPVLDANGKITDFLFIEANKMLAAYVGQTPDTVKGALGSTWFPGYKTNGLFEKYSHTAITGITNRFEFHYDVDGIDVWLDIMSTKVQDGVLVTFTDFTAMKNLQRRLEEHVKELSSSNASLEQFAYIASHDLQEPLRKVKSFGDMLHNRYSEALGAGGADIIARMQSAAARMSTLIDDLLTYSRASVKPAALQVVDVNKVIEGVLFDLERAIVQKNAKVYRDKIQPVAGQETQIGQIFLNLVSNALKFSKPGTTPEVRITSKVVQGKDAGIFVPAAQLDKQFQLIRIADNGIGFDNIYRDRIFQIFQRLNTRSEYPGSGVGLSIVKKVVENHGGYIEAASEPGQGAAFSILLPLAMPPA